jgi:putative transposase
MEIGDPLEQGDSIERFKKALSRLFPSIFSDVGNRKHIAERTGISLLDDEQIEKRLAADALPERMEAKRFLIQQLIARGYKRKEIAEKLNVSVKTIYNILHPPEMEMERKQQ